MTLLSRDEIEWEWGDGQTEWQDSQHCTLLLLIAEMHKWSLELQWPNTAQLIALQLSKLGSTLFWESLGSSSDQRWFLVGPKCMA